MLPTTTAGRCPRCARRSCGATAGEQAAWQPRAGSLGAAGAGQRRAHRVRRPPLTIRQIFYRLVGAHGYDKTERAYDQLGEDVRALCADREHDVDVAFTRLAVTPMQITTLGLPTAPPKSTDPRRFDGIEAVQAEAIPPDILAEIIQQAIDDRLDDVARHLVLNAEVDARTQLLEAPSGKWLEFEGGVISGLFEQPGPALERRGRSRHDDG